MIEARTSASKSFEQFTVEPNVDPNIRASAKGEAIYMKREAAEARARTKRSDWCTGALSAGIYVPF